LILAVSRPRATCSTGCPCPSDAAWCIRVDGVCVPSPCILGVGLTMAMSLRRATCSHAHRSLLSACRSVVSVPHPPHTHTQISYLTSSGPIRARRSQTGPGPSWSTRERRDGWQPNIPRTVQLVYRACDSRCQGVVDGFWGRKRALATHDGSSVCRGVVLIQRGGSRGRAKYHSWVAPWRCSEAAYRDPLAPFPPRSVSPNQRMGGDRVK